MKKILDHNHAKYITTLEFDKLMEDNFARRLTQASLQTKTDTADFIKKKEFDDKLKNLNKKFTSNKTKCTSSKWI